MCHAEDSEGADWVGVGGLREETAAEAVGEKEREEASRAALGGEALDCEVGLRSEESRDSLGGEAGLRDSLGGEAGSRNESVQEALIEMPEALIEMPEALIEMPEAPWELAADDTTLSLREGRHGSVQRVAVLEGETTVEAFRRVQRERSGAGAVFVIRLETP